MDAKIADVLKDYDARYAAETELMGELSREEAAARIDEFLIPIGPQVGQFVHDLAVAMDAKVMVEFGTSYGYSAVWLGMAAQRTGGKLISLDLAADKQRFAKARLEQAGLADHVEFIAGDAIEVVAGLDQAFDLVLIDLWKDLYIPAFEAVASKLASPAFVIADNMVYPPDSRQKTATYSEHVRTKTAQSILLPIGNGIEVSRF